MTTALAEADPAAALAPLEQVIQLLGTWTEVGPVVDLMSQAAAFKQLLRDQEASLEAQQKAGEIHLRAQRRAGELLAEQAERGERAARTDNLRRAPKAQPEPSGAAAPAPPPKPTLEELGIERNKAQRWQALAKVPAKKFEDYIEAAKANGAEITTAGAMNAASRRHPHAASNVNNDAGDKNIRFTPRWMVEWLKAKFGLNWDFAGHPAAPATEIFGLKRIWTVEDDCLRQDWSGKFGLGNWEWDKLNLFFPFAFLQIATGAGKGVAQPIPTTRTEQRFFQEFIRPFRPEEGGQGALVLFPRGPNRARAGYGTLLDPEGERKDNQPGMPTMVVVFRGPFTRSPDVPPLGTIEEVLEEMRFGEDRGLAHLWRQALAVARGGWSGGTRHARALVAAVPPETSGAPAGAPTPNAEGHDGGRKAGTELIMTKCCGEDFNFRVADAAKGLERLRAHLKRRHAQQSEQVGAAFSIERFRGEATNLGFGSRVVERPTHSFIACRCGAKKCRTELRALVTPEKTVPLHQLQQLRDHYQEHARPVRKRAPKTSSPKGRKKR